MNRYIKLLALMGVLAAGLFALAGCSDKKDEPTPGPDPVEPVNTTVLVYMAASNSLGVQLNDSMDIKEMQRAARAGHLNGGRLLIYHAGYKTAQTLSEITADGKIRLIKEYGADGLTSVHAARMKQVLSDARAEAPSRNFGLVLWSHGDGWLQNGIDDKTLPGLDQAPEDGAAVLDVPSVAGWGMENSRKMKVSTLARTLEQSQPIDFVYFDCCYMASVEVAYEMRRATPVIVGSVIELPAEGMPYHKTLQHLFRTSWPDLEGAARETFSHFDAMFGEDRTCSMSVINTAAMRDLADVTRRVYERCNVYRPLTYEPQAFMTSGNCSFYDFADYVRALCDECAPELREEWDEAYAAAILYFDTTPYLWSRVSLSRNNGLSTYIMSKSNNGFDRQYDTLEWYKDVASHFAI